MSDISNGSWSTTDGSNTAAPPDGWPSNMFPNQVEPTAQAMMGGTKRWWERANAGITTTGSAGAYALASTNTSYPTAYTQGEVYGGKANFTSVGGDTLVVNSLAALPIYVQSAGGPTAITAGAIRSGQQFLVAYDLALNSGAGGFQLLSAASSATSSSVSGSVGVVNGRMSVTSAGQTATFAADEVITETALGGTAYKLASYSQAVNLGTTGAGGMDTGSPPASGFVALYAINKTDGTTSILACNVTTSSAEVYGGGSMPSGYVASALLGIWPTNGSSQFPIGIQMARGVSFPAVNVLNITSAAATTYTSELASAAVPPSATTMSGILGTPSGGTGTQAFAIAADTSGTGERMYNGAGGLLFDSFAQGANFYGLPLITAQTFYYKAFNSSVTVRVSVTGYTF